MNKSTLTPIVVLLVASLSASCSTNRGISLIPPVGVDGNQALKIDHECLVEAKELQNTPLTHEEDVRLAGIETNAFWHYGKGRSLYADRWVLCHLNRNYQPVEFTTPWLPISRCKLLKLYQEGGIEKDRLEYICKTKHRDDNCEACGQTQDRK